jgi:hypothetical protein
MLHIEDAKNAKVSPPGPQASGPRGHGGSATNANGRSYIEPLAFMPLPPWLRAGARPRRTAVGRLSR